MGLSTKNVKTGGGGMPKTIQPGNTKAKILGIKLDQPHFLVKDNAYFVVLELETPKPDPSFEGFFIDKDDQSLGRHEGQVGRVKASRWSYQDTTTKSGIEINRDQEIMKFVKNICNVGGTACEKWWKEVDEVHLTIEPFIEAFNEAKPWGDQVFNWCIAGREYEKDNGYTAYDLHLPKFSKDGVPFEGSEAKLSRVIKFDDDEHLQRVEAKPVDKFSAEDNSDKTPDSGTDGVPEFEI